MLIDLAKNRPSLLEPVTKIIIPDLMLDSEALVLVGPLEPNDRFVYFVEPLTTTVSVPLPNEETVIVSPETFVTRPMTAVPERSPPNKLPPGPNRR